MRERLKTIVVLALLATFGCHRPGVDASSRAERGAALARVQAAHDAFEAARHRLAAPTDGHVEAAATTAFDRAFARYQSELARFLTAALNQSPEAPETKAGVELFVGTAVELANETLERGGDLQVTLQALTDARQYCKIAAISPPEQLGSAIGRVSARLAAGGKSDARGFPRP